jgi:hypothetical protein
MNSSPDEVIGRSIATLRQLSQVLEHSAPERKARELLLTIGVLLPKLEAARPILQLPLIKSRCEICDE